MREKTIFQQYLVFILLPVLVLLVVLAVYNVKKTNRLLTSHFDDTNSDYANEIQTLLELQDYSLKLVEQNLDARIRVYSDRLIHQHFANTEGIRDWDLDKIREKMSFSFKNLDLYVIDRRGDIVNTTFTADYGKNITDFGKETKDLVARVFEKKNYEGGEFIPEVETNSLRKYTYQATLDGKFIIEIGVKSAQANEITRRVRLKLNKLTQRGKCSIKSIDLFIGDENPVSFNHKSSKIDRNHLNIYNQVLEGKGSLTRDTLISLGNAKTHYQYVYMPRESEIYEGSVIRIVSDREQLIAQKKSDTIFYTVIISLFIAGGFVAGKFFLSYFITQPIDDVVKSFAVISTSDLTAQVTVKGNKEIRYLTSQFNKMTKSLQSYLGELETAVKEDILQEAQYLSDIEEQKEQISFQQEGVILATERVEKITEIVEHQNKQITESIHYAKRIENLYLPSNNLLDRVLKDYFMLYKPRNVVGGDFYWVDKVKGKIIIICADCTGHGVPGAFLSNIGATMLTRIVKDKNLIDPCQILDELQVGINRVLFSSTEHHIVDETIGISIVVIDEEENQLHYVGAGAPIVLVHDDEVNYFRGEKEPLRSSSVNRVFQKQTVRFHPGDVLYSFTDGYQDQIGGDQEKKFMIRRLRNLFFRIHELPVEEQESIISTTLEDWMINSSQVDDILIIGLKL